MFICTVTEKGVMSLKETKGVVRGKVQREEKGKEDDVIFTFRKEVKRECVLIQIHCSPQVWHSDISNRILKA